MVMIYKQTVVIQRKIESWCRSITSVIHIFDGKKIMIIPSQHSPSISYQFQHSPSVSHQY